jgi:hypothetical protein
MEKVPLLPRQAKLTHLTSRACFRKDVLNISINIGIIRPPGIVERKIFVIGWSMQTTPGFQIAFQGVDSLAGFELGHGVGDVLL